MIVRAMQGGDVQFDSELRAVLAPEGPFAHWSTEPSRTLASKVSTGFGVRKPIFGQQVVARLKFVVEQEAVDGRSADQFRA